MSSPILVSAFSLASVLWAGTEYPALPGQPVVPNQLLVRYKSGTAVSSVATTMVPGAQYVPLPHVPNVYLIQVPATAPTNYSTLLSQHPLVDYVEPNRIRHVAIQSPNDPYVPALGGNGGFIEGQWDLTKIQALQAWQLLPNVYLTSGTAGSGRIKVAVIDTGLDCTHPDFKNAGGGSLDAASGGQVSFTLSETFVPTNVSDPVCPWQDDYGHGTHVSGTVAAATNNGAGVAALGYPLEIIEYKVFDDTGQGNDANIADAITAAVDAGASVLSMSFGETGYSQTLQNAVTYAWQRNVVPVAAAGNDSRTEVFFPASANHAMGVSATDESDTKASFSNYGPLVAIAAPGNNILSTTPTYTDPLDTATSYDILSGTSMAAPHVSALAGLIEMATPNLSATVVGQRIQQSADATDPTVSSGGWGPNQGYGRMNAYRALSGTLRPATVGGIVGQVVNSSGAPVATATVVVKQNGTFVQQVTTDSSPADGLFRISNIAAGATYQVTVSATGFTTVNLSAAVAAGADTNLTVILGVTTGQFSGLVTDALSGNPIGGAVVAAVSSGLIQATAVTDSSGTYTLAVPPGTYDLQASAMYGVTSTVASQAVSASGSKTVNIAMPMMGTISGTAVANAQITITGPGYSAGAVANSSGSFSTIPIPAGTYSVNATSTSPAFNATVSGVVVNNDQNTVVSFQQNVTVNTSPQGLQIIVDGTTLTAPQFFNWTAGTPHTLSVPSPQNNANTRATFAQWDDGTTALPRNVTAPAAGQTVTFTATFSASYLLTLAASPSSGGTLAPNPTSPTGDGFYASGTPVQVTATANTGFTFSNFSGSLSGSTNPQTVTMSAPRSVTANFSSPTAITVTTNPSGLPMTVDGTPYTSPQAFNWAAGSNHTIAVTSPQSGAAGTRYAWGSWSDGGAISHNITAPATATTYTANFNTQYLLTLAASPSGGGTLAPNPASPTGDGYYASGTPVQVTATANSGYVFANFSGGLTGSTDPQTVTMSAPQSVTGNFSAIVNATVTTSPAGLAFTVDGLSYNVPHTFTNWVPGSQHTLAIVTNPQMGPAGTRYAWLNWSDAGTISHAVTAPAGGTSITYTANFNTQYLLTLAASPAGDGTLAPNPASPTGDGYYNSGTPVTLTAAASAGFSFTSFTGDLTGSTNPQQLLMSAPHSVTANFSSGTTSSGPLAAYWKLNEGSGATSFTDSSGDGNTGTCSGGACPTMGVPGKAGTAASFNGTSDQITVQDSPSLRLNQFTIVLWVYPKQMDGNYQPLLVKEDSSGNNRNYGLFIVPGTMQVRYAVWAHDCATKFAANSVGQLELNTWNQIAFTYDGSVERFYLNGVLDSSNSASAASLCQAAVPVKLGKENTVFQAFSGSLDAVQIYNQALSAASVSSLYSALVASWNLDEPFGATSFADASGDGNTGACGSACPTMAVPGKVGTAASFNGVNDQITVPDSPSLRLNQFTIGMWVFPKQEKTNYQPLLAKEDSSGNFRDYGLFIAPNTMQVRYAVWAGDCATKFAANSVGQLTMNAWNHVVFTYDGNTESLYINGVLDSTNPASTASLCQAVVPIKIGMETGAFLPFNGVLDDIVIYNQALSAAGVTNLYDSPAAYWKLNEPFGATSFADSSGTGNTGTCSGDLCPTMGVPGKVGMAASFNGSQITVPDSPSLRLNQFTIALWVNPAQAQANYQPLVVKEDSSGSFRNYGLFMVPNSTQVRYVVWGNDCSTRFAANSSGSLALNNWNYVVFTYDGTTESLYINGVLDSSNPASTPAGLCQALVPVNIGMESAAAGFLPFSGVLDDIRIYAQPLSAAGVSSLYSGF